MTREHIARGFDFHCHVDLYPDPAGMVAACEANRIFTLAVTTTPRAWPQNRKWTAQSNYTHTAVGLHPELVGERSGEVSLLEEYIGETSLVGEVGLDGSPQHRKSWDDQKTVFVRALSAADSKGGRIVTIHSRRAANEVVACLGEKITPGRVLPILHWFSGSIGTARKAAALGCYFSINHLMLSHESGVALARSLPEERLLTETDGPFTLNGERKSEPVDVLSTAEQLAALRGHPSSRFAEILHDNAAQVLAFGGLAFD